jgi:hypothetical protein
MSKISLPRLLKRSKDAPDVHEEARRREKRIPVKADAVIGDNRSAISRTSILDLSCHGCSLTMGENTLHSGEFIMIRLEGAEAIRGIVRWIRDGEAGVEFLRPLDQAALHYHAANNPSVLSVDRA